MTKPQKSLSREPSGRQYADQYVRATVTLATVLLLIAISQRFKTRRVRVGLLVIAVSCCAFRFTTSLRCPKHRTL